MSFCRSILLLLLFFNIAACAHSPAGKILRGEMMLNRIEKHVNQDNHSTSTPSNKDG